MARRAALNVTAPVMIVAHKGTTVTASFPWFHIRHEILRVAALDRIEEARKPVVDPLYLGCLIIKAGEPKCDIKITFALFSIRYLIVGNA